MELEGMERRKFTREFKLEAVRLIKDRGVSYVQASQDLNVHPSQLRDWVKKFSEDPLSRQEGMEALSQKADRIAVAYNVGVERLLRLRVSQLGRHRLHRLNQSLKRVSVGCSLHRFQNGVERPLKPG
jgi:transposase-like protein